MTDAMTCTDFDERLADYLEGELGLAERQAVQAHMASCVRCAALVRDLERISADAGALAELAPSRDLWAGIAERIDTPIVPLAPRMAPDVALRSWGGERLRLAAVAAALVAVTAGVTYTLTVSGGTAPSTIVAAAPYQQASDALAPAVVRPSAPDQPITADIDSSSSQPDDVQLQGAPTAQRVGNATAAAPQSREIDRLRTIFARNRGQLDPRTAAIIEANLKVIDDAIAQSREALAQDPASRFLNNQLNTALDKKLDLLRTAAMLPSRT